MTLKFTILFISIIFWHDAIKASPGGTKEETVIVKEKRPAKIAAQPANPIKIIDAQSIEQTGAQSLPELFERLSESPNGNFNGSSNAVRSGAATIDLLGLGSHRTVVLLDGLRLPIESGFSAVNISHFPLAMIERIEIISGGASAIYGADAIGGVVNIITKKDFLGHSAEISRQWTKDKGGERFEASAVSGIKIGEAHIQISGSYEKQEAILRRQRSYENGVAPYENTETNPPAGTFSYRNYDFDIDDWGPWQASPNCPGGNTMATQAAPNDQNTYCAGPRDENEDWLSPQTTSGSISSFLNWQLSDTLHLSTHVLYSQRHSRFKERDSAILNPLVSGETLRDLGVAVALDSQVSELMYRDYNLPDLWNINVDKMLGGSIKVDGMVSNNWQWQVSASHFISRNQRFYDHVIDRQNLQDKIYPVDAEGYSMPVDPAYIAISPNRADNLYDLLLTDLHTNEVNRLWTLEASMIKNFQVWTEAPAQLTLGVSHQKESFEINPDAKDQSYFTPQFSNNQMPRYVGNMAVQGKGRRDLVSPYISLMLPLTQKLELLSAVRLDHYSDFGSPVNYQAGLKWWLLDQLVLRSSASTVFRAPPLSVIHKRGGGVYMDLQDSKACELAEAAGESCELASTRTIFVTDNGNKKIHEEKGYTYTAGVVFSPWRRLTLISDYHYIRLNGTLKMENHQKVLDRYNAGGDLGANNVNVNADGLVTEMSVPLQNLDIMEVRAVSSSLELEQPYIGQVFGLRSSLFNYLSYKVQDKARAEDGGDSPLKQYIGFKGFPRFKMNHAVYAHLYREHLLTMSATTIGRQQTDPDEKFPGQIHFDVAQHTQYDFTYLWMTSWKGKLSLGVTNIFNKLGGKDYSGREEDVAKKIEYFDMDQYSPLGRAYTVAYAQSL